MQPVIILYAKAPVAGRVKTRLQPRLSAVEAAALHTAFVFDMVERFQAIPGITLELQTDIPTDVWSSSGVSQRLQQTGDLGLKMVHSLGVALKEGASRAILVGTDAPTLPAGHLGALLEADADVALGPTDDGGYYAISARRVDERMFEGVRWSEPEALRQTLSACAACGLSTSIGPAWFDVDEPADLDRLMNTGDLPRHTAAWFENYIGR